MSDKRIESVCLVIDTSIAHSAGGFEADHPIGTACREVLLRVRGICHRMAFGERMQEEWTRHLSGFARTWLVSMVSMNKIVFVDDTPESTHLDTIREHAADPGLVDVMEKDAHLLAAAVRTAHRILSLDDKIRHHFAGKLRAHADVLAIAWVNPCKPDDEAIEWLNRGAPMEASPTLAKLPLLT